MFRSSGRNFPAPLRAYVFRTNPPNTAGAAVVSAAHRTGADRAVYPRGGPKGQYRVRLVMIVRPVAVRERPMSTEEKRWFTNGPVSRRNPETWWMWHGW